jgi:hypothetical protein
LLGLRGTHARAATGGRHDGEVAGLEILHGAHSIRAHRFREQARAISKLAADTFFVVGAGLPANAALAAERFVGSAASTHPVRRAGRAA